MVAPLRGRHSIGNFSGWRPMPRMPRVFLRHPPSEQNVNDIVKKLPGQPAPAALGTVEWARHAVARDGRRQRLRGLRLRAVYRFQPCFRPRCGKANDDVDNKTRTAAAWLRKDGDRPIRRLYRRNRHPSLNLQTQDTKEALSYSFDLINWLVSNAPVC